MLTTGTNRKAWWYTESQKGTEWGKLNYSDQNKITEIFSPIRVISHSFIHSFSSNMTGFTSAADNDDELTKCEDDAIADDDNVPGYVGDDEDEIAVVGMALINAILEHAPKEEIQKLLDEDAPLWYQDEDDGWSALHAAASVEDAELVKNLLQHGAVWNSGETWFLNLSHSARKLLKVP